MNESFPNPSEKALMEVREELRKMAATDQETRTSGRMDVEIDKRNTARLKEIIAKHGWPTVSTFGSKAANNAWLLVQHADAEPSFQEECLQILKDLPEGEASKGHIAYLEDRVRVNTGRPTLYGTQFYEVEGRLVPRPIESPDQLEERREAAGLETFEEYKAHMEKLNQDRKQEGKLEQKN